MSSDNNSFKQHSLSCRLRIFILIVVVPVIVVLTAGWCVVFYNNLHKIIIDGFDKKLFGVSSVTGFFIKGEEHAQIAQKADETSEFYLKYINPMKNINKNANLTYLYSQILAKEKPYCFYILDATEGEEHTAIGEKDKLPITDYIGARNVMDYGVVHIGDVQSTENWGLIKVSYAPIYNEDNSITSMAGADINISIIKDKTRIALFAISLLGVIALLGVGYISLIFSRKLIKPIGILRDGALMVAAGSYDHKIIIDKFIELNKLAHGFNTISETLKTKLTDLTIANREIKARKQLNDLMRALDKSEKEIPQSCALFNSSAAQKTPSGWIMMNNGNILFWVAHNPGDMYVRQCSKIVNDGKTLFWMAQPDIISLDAVRLRSDIAMIAKQLFEKSKHDMERLTIELQRLFPKKIKSFFIYERKNCKLHCLPSKPFNLMVMNENGFSNVKIKKKHVIKIKNNERIFICDKNLTMSESFIEKLNAQKTWELAKIMSVIQTEALSSDEQAMFGIAQGTHYL